MTTDTVPQSPPRAHELPEQTRAAIDPPEQTRVAIVALAHDASSLSLEIADIAANVNAVSDASVAQTAAFEQIRAATSQLLNTTRDSAVAARAAGEAARDATGAARQSTERVNDSLLEVQSLARWSAETVVQLQSVVGVISELRTAAGKLSEVAEQTQILSLNARIEAARSGEHGRGFAVIADSVRALSEDAKETTKDIAGRISNLVNAVDRLTAGGVEAAEKAAAVEAGSSEIRSELARVTEAITVADQRVELIAAGALEAESALGDVDGAIESVTRDVDEQTSNLSQARDRINALRTTAERVMRLTAEAGVETSDARMIAVTKQGAAHFEELFEEAVASGRLGLAELFDEEYQLIAGSDPKQYRIRSGRFLEQIAPAVQEPILEGYEGVRGSCLHDRNGFRPMMNVCFSQAQRPDTAWNAKYARHRSFATDEAGLAASRNTEPVLVQAYRRTAMGKVELTKDVSVPIFVRGRHWGSLRTVYVDS